VRLPPGFDIERADLKIQLPLREWQALGVRRADGGALPEVDLPASLVLPAGYTGPAFLVYQNFRVILGWNRSILYAIAVGHLADRIAGGGPITAPRPAGEERLSREQVLAMQDALNRLGHDTGTPDGIVGAMTREALRGFQRANGLPPDGYPTPALVTRILTAAGG
jgi:membrane-bound lytic murein transglycosylase B